ncbi:hypothetical protein I3760_08G032400 [Carya illinoinensis]|uniref:Uncharacterized protein n=1 Tax=Carya illinoinensis TaxID=32201 RepID=A0A922E8S4_CARIL|nr:hypothetical protein I3760_08G032400 [Carya illinoinensis]KAG6698699.1 hypothetical protein I3842_08G032100 [Carya illinoinensis]
MEANKERRDQSEIKKQEEIRGQGEKKKYNDNNVPENTTTQSSTGFDPMVKILIRETIVTDSGGDHQGDHGTEAPDDVLAFSRAVHKIDSSLE